MKINKLTLVALFSALGRKVDEWDDKTLIERARQIPAKFAQDKIPEDQTELCELWNGLSALDSSEDIELTGTEAPSGPVDLEGMERSELIAFASSKGIEVDRKKNTQELRTRINHALKNDKPIKTAKAVKESLKVEKAPKTPKAEKAPKAEKPAKEEKAEKAPKAPPKPKRQPPVKDKFGNRINTIAAKVNSVMSKNWKTEEEIIEASGLKQIETRGRLYHAVRNGIYEVERVIRYRIAPEKAA